MTLHPEPYYDLAVEALGNTFHCSCGSYALQATDSRYARGRLGIRGNSLGKIAAAQVEMTPGQRAYNQILRSNNQRKIEALRLEYPALVEARRLDLRQFGEAQLELAYLRTPARPDLLLHRQEGDQVHALALDWQLNVLWERNRPLTSGKYAVYRDGPDGQRQLVTLRRNHFEVIDLGTGQTVATPPFPRPVRHRLWPLAAGMAERPGNVQGKDLPGDLLLRYCDAPAFDDAAVRLLVMDENFSEIWSIDAASPGLGHTFGAQFFDVDGEGRDEVLASYQLLSPEGAPLWLMEANKDIAGRPGARHIDFAIIGDFAGDAELDPTLFVCSGDIYVVDGRSGRTRAHHRSARASFRCPVGANCKSCPGQSQARKIFRPRSLHLGDLYRPPAFPIG